MANSNGERKPLPDPTSLTTKQLERAIGNLEALLDAKFDGLKSVLHEQFVSIEKQFRLVESQRIEQKADATTSVAAALTAQKEAVKEQTTAFALATDKSEAATTKSIEEVRATLSTAIEGLRREMGDIKERVVGGEGTARGAHQQHSATQSWQIWAAGAGITIIIAFIIIIANVLTGSP